MSAPSWWLHRHCFIDQAPVTPLQGMLVCRGFLPGYLTELELSVTSPGHVPFAFYSEKRNSKGEKTGKRHSQAIIQFSKLLVSAIYLELSI